MRVITGTAKGRRLTAPEGGEVRPTSDRVKEALFSILYPVLHGARVIDLYAGSGALGIEALSRGAAAAVFVDVSERAVAAIGDNLAACGFTERAEILRGEVAGVLGRDQRAGGGFDVALLDPPYGIDPGELAAVLDALVAHLAPDARVAVETGRASAAPVWPDRLNPTDPRRYGDTMLHLADLVDDEGG